MITVAMLIEILSDLHPDLPVMAPSMGADKCTQVQAVIRQAFRGQPSSAYLYLFGGVYVGVDGYPVQSLTQGLDYVTGPAWRQDAKRAMASEHGSGGFWDCDCGRECQHKDGPNRLEGCRAEWKEPARPIVHPDPYGRVEPARWPGDDLIPVVTKSGGGYRVTGYQARAVPTELDSNPDPFAGRCNKDAEA